MTEHGIVVDHHLAIERDQALVFCNDQRIDLGQGGIVSL